MYIIFVRIDAIERFSSIFFILDMGMKCVLELG